MSHTPGFDFAVHWVEKRQQYRLRFMWYRNHMIYSWYQYVPHTVSVELMQTREPYRSMALGVLYLLWPGTALYRLFFVKDISKYFHYVIRGIWLVGLGFLALALFLLPVLLLFGVLD